MRAVIQRVSEASVTIDGEIKGAIGRGLLVFLGIESEDGPEDLAWLSGKIPQIRLFPDEAGKMNLAITEIDGEILLISQFTLFGNLRKGSRPSFNRAAPPEMAVPVYEEFVGALSNALGKPVVTGEFGAMMKIQAVNDGPVTLFIDTKNKKF